MIYEFTSYKEAEKAAIEHSIKNPGVGVYVNWLEDNYWNISNYQDYPGQDYYLNGQKYMPDDYDDYDDGYDED